VLDERDQLKTFFGDLTGLSDTATRLLADNEADLVRVGQVTEPVLRLLAVYSPEFPCLLEGAADYRPRLARVFRGNMIRQYFVFNTPQYREYDHRDEPVYGEVGHGPWCLGLPHPPEPIGPQPLRDGTDMDDDPPSSTVPGTQPSSWGGLPSGYAGSEGDQAVMNALLAGRTGRPADSYGALGSLLYGPVVREGGART
jgi:phospholipid/cholesterol/gamma-HCH transport system substrate-binding protein